MRVLVTGHRGYIGSVLTTVLRHARYEVAGLDCDYYRGCDFGRVHEVVNNFEMDLRDVEFTDLLSFDAVVHLADLPPEAAHGSSPREACEINEEATLRLAECCKQAEVSRLLFASSCDVYRRGGAVLNEQSPVDPATPAAASKLRCERALAAMAGPDFTPVFLRHASVYGVSPRIRTDLVVNDFVASAVATGRVVLQDNGMAWLPVVHVEDLCRVYAAILSAPDDLVHNQAVNVISSCENYRSIDIADMVTELVPSCTRSADCTVFDKPGYRVDGMKLQRTFPGLSFRWTLPMGIRQLRTAMLGCGLTPGDFRSDRYRRLARLRTLMEQGELGADLRRTEPAVA